MDGKLKHIIQLFTKQLDMEMETSQIHLFCLLSSRNVKKKERSKKCAHVNFLLFLAKWLSQNIQVIIQ